ncbi:hypothetical protein [Enterococcus hirae]|uniref:hypothetical protein n=1 Tax=Enterococcus hirae TaxID=1354 RepID=UPI0009BF2CF6|nr:hypothetical protein [Enterococcus hirae]EMF0307648.1 hypothetical protein [Enterococcus hirae]OQO33489.1 hypothetical protein BH731_11310 [Enterococcus hirae]OQO39274.1 hypothetical protein BH738_01405 [Enterococcus hirae]
MNFYVIKFGQYFYRKSDRFINGASLNLTSLLQDSQWFASYGNAKETAEKFGGEVKECSVSGLENMEDSE